MRDVRNYRPLGCAQCRDGAILGLGLSMAFQPIVDITRREVFAHEALVRSVAGEPAATVFTAIDDDNCYAFDQACRVTAVSLAAHLQLQGLLSINFMPNAVYRPELCIRTTIEAADSYGFDIRRILFEVTEGERVDDIDHLRDIIDDYRGRGFRTAIDDFGAGYAGLNLLADLETDFLKLDMALIRDIHQHPRRRAIVRGVVAACSEMAIGVVAEGVECHEEYLALRDLGIELFQGYYFARPAFEAVPVVNWPD